MPKVTIHKEPETPTKAAVKSAAQLVYVTDSTGRRLGLRRVPFLEEFRIVEAVGAERAANQAYMGMLQPLLFIAEIDGDQLDFPRTHAQIEALIQRAGHEGFVAAIEGMTEHFAADQKELESKIKNGPGTPASETVSGS